MHRSASAVLAAALVSVVLAVGACGDDDAGEDAGGAGEEAALATTTTAGSPDTTAAPEEPATSAPTTTASTAPPVSEYLPSADVILEATVAGGSVRVGGGRQSVPLGSSVALVVTADTDDEVHVHGYDVYADVEAGATAVLEFTADIPGVFEVELEDAGLPLWDLEVS